MPEKITLYKLKKPDTHDLNLELQWFSQSLGLFGSRDKEKSCFRVFIALVEAKKQHRFLSSDEIADKANLTRATVIHHLKNLEDHGFVKEERGRYSLSSKNFSALIKAVERECRELFGELEEIAGELDRKLELA